MTAQVLVSTVWRDVCRHVRADIPVQRKKRTYAGTCGQTSRSSARIGMSVMWQPYSLLTRQATPAQGRRVDLG